MNLKNRKKFVCLKMLRKKILNQVLKRLLLFDMLRCLKWEIIYDTFYIISRVACCKSDPGSIISVNLWSANEAISVSIDLAWFVIDWIMNQMNRASIAFIWFISVWTMSFLMNKIKGWLQHRNVVAIEDKTKQRSKEPVSYTHLDVYKRQP